MKIYTCSLSALILLFGLTVFAQENKSISSNDKGIFFGKVVQGISESELSARFVRYQLYEIDASAITSYLRENNNSAAFTLNLESHFQWDISLEENELRSADYKSYLIVNGRKELQPATPCVTYKGFLLNSVDGGEVRLTIDKNLILGYVMDGGEQFYIEPLRDIIRSAGENIFIVYSSKDVVSNGKLKCALDDVKKYRINESEISEGNNSSRGICMELEVATAADTSMLNKFGSTSVVNTHILSVMNIVEPNYSPFELDFLVNEQIVTSGSDPWTSSTDIGTLLNDFTAWGPSNFGSHDIGQLWSNRDYNGGTIGLAWVGTVCSANQYSVVQDFTGDLQALRCMSAHEMGHNFSATHDTAGSPFIMAPAISGGIQNFSANSISQISSYISGVSCLTPCVTGISFESSDDLDLFMNVFPNPFSGEFKIEFNLPALSEISLTLYNSIGQKIKVLSDGKQNKGEHFLGADISELNIGEGMYYLVLRSGGKTISQKLLHFGQ